MGGGRLLLFGKWLIAGRLWLCSEIFAQDAQEIGDAPLGGALVL